MKRRLILHPPSHPMFLVLLLFIAIAPLIWLYFIPKAIALAFLPLGLGVHVGYTIAVLMVLLSMALSPVNVVLMEVPRQVAVPDFEYVSIFGIPYPTLRVRYVMSSTAVAVNLGGAVIPLAISILVVSLLAVHQSGAQGLGVLVGVAALVTVVSHLSSRIVPGVGIVVPALIPPLVSALSAITLSAALGVMSLAPSIAYAGAVIGTLLGADVLNLVKHFDKLQSPMVSIGGAGTFDGIYLSGIIALFLALILT
ncbi:MAG: hypothetical protein DRJ68_06250 [Thermoprotei archaeon]|nr:MAG: hypothetical protein DRJ68_06250 [Thermoprotei archaeon]